MAIIFHLGFPKAASTTLQKQLFDKAKDINYLGIYPKNTSGTDTQDFNKSSVYNLNDKLVEFHNYIVQAEKCEDQELKEKFDSIKGLLDTDKVNVFSNERVLSVFFSYPDFYEKVSRLKHAFEGFQIEYVIVFRNQYDILKALYRDHPFDPRNLTGGSFLNFDEWVKSALSLELLKMLLDYNQLISNLEDILGKQKIHVFFFEDLIGNNDLEFKRLSKILGINEDKVKQAMSVNENVGSNDMYFNYRRYKQIVKRSIPTGFIRIIKPVGAKIDLIVKSFTKHSKKKKVELLGNIDQDVRQQFEVSNRLLFERLERDPILRYIDKNEI